MNYLFRIEVFPLSLLLFFTPAVGYSLPHRVFRKNVMFKNYRALAHDTSRKSNNIPLGAIADDFNDDTRNKYPMSTNRRSSLREIGFFSLFGAITAFRPFPSEAATDCFSDCFKNCKIIAPQNPEYCTSNCRDYCDQPDREDGLSGSVSSVKGEVGILGTSTVVKGDDKPPNLKLPGLDFNSEKGKKLIGY